MEKEAILLKNIFSFAEMYLSDLCPDGVDIGKYVNNDKSYTDLNTVCRFMIESAQNRNMLPGVIQFQERHAVFKEILFNFDPQLILDYYDDESLFQSFQEKFSVKNPTSPRNLWRLFAKSIISICTFLTHFEDAQAFDDFVMTFTKNEITRAALPMVLEKEIYGFGFALACDFLKELGYTEYPKPDDHLMDVYSELGICIRDPYLVYKAAIRMAEACRKTAYYVDKTIWLICSGNYYLDGVEIPGKKRELIESFKKVLNE
ncbi:MAG: hypothetical protein Q7J07_07345 [Pelolinea sp.]|nr:hypothetical protein [Pelolinea sp.]